MLALACLALLLAGAGCGTDDGEASADEPLVIETTAAETPTDDLDTFGFEGLAADECVQLIGVGGALGQAFTGTAGLGGGGDV